MPKSPPRGDNSAQFAERRSQFRGEEIRLLPGGEVAALLDLVEVSKPGINRLNPAARCREDLARKCREGNRDFDWRRRLAGCARSGPPGFPVPPGGRGAGARQPVQRDVVYDAFTGETAHGLALDERAGHLVVAVRVVVEHP